jgi:hypothetical protein
MRSSDNGATWSHAETLCRSDYWSYWKCASDEDGNVYVAWCRLARNFVRRSTDDGLTWSTADTISHIVDTIFAEHEPYVYCLGRINGDTVALTRSTNRGASWETARRAFASPGVQSSLKATDDGGRLHMAWAGGQSGNSEVYYSRSTDCGITWSLPYRLTISSGASLWWLSVSKDVAYVSYDVGGPDKKRVSTDAGISWGVESAWPYPWTGPGVASSVCALSDGGRAHLLQYDYGPNNTKWVEYRRSRDFGVTWPDSAMVSDSNSLDRYPGAIVCDGSDVHVLWADYEYGNYEIMYRRGAGLAGIVESEDPPLATHNSQSEATVVRGVLFLPAATSHKPQASGVLLDIAGRNAMELRPGPNDVSGLSPGVYFVRHEPSAAGRQPSAVTKVVIQR